MKNMKNNLSNMRLLKFKKSYLPHAEGSCMVSMGLTKVLCVASVEDKVPPHAEEKGTGWVHAEYAMLPRSGVYRSSRGKVTGGGRVQEISRLIGRSLRAAVDLKALYPFTITLDCDVIRADGGTRTASVNGGMVALAQALRFLKTQGKLSGLPLKRFVGAVSLGVVRGSTVLDMSYEADKEAELDLNLVMDDSGKIIEIQGTAENGPFSLPQLNTMIKLGASGIRKIISKQKSILGLPIQKSLMARR